MLHVLNALKRQSGNQKKRELIKLSVETGSEFVSPHNRSKMRPSLSSLHPKLPVKYTGSMGKNQITTAASMLFEAAMIPAGGVIGLESWYMYMKTREKGMQYCDS